MMRRFFFAALMSLSLTVPALAAPLNPSRPDDLKQLQQQAPKDPYAAAVLSQAIFEKIVSPTSPNQGLELILSASKAGHPMGLFMHCAAAKDGYLMAADAAKASELCGKAKAGLTELAATDLNAMYSLGYMYYYGLGVEEDNDDAMTWFRKAAEQGHVIAMCYVGYMLDEALGFEEDDAEAVRWYKLSSESGYAIAQYNLGLMYRDGTGTAKDDKASMHWFSESAERGDPDAQYELGMGYREGRGVSLDWRQAHHWLGLSANQGIAEAQYTLGLMYRDGLGVSVDHAKALDWLRKAAEQEHEDAQSALESLM